MATTDPERARRLRAYRSAATALVIVALVAAVIYGGVAAPRGAFLLALFATFMAAAAPFSLGVFIGFLFGIPKSRQQPATASNQPLELTQPNTNLEQVSDWLTKLLIGVGLTQLTKLPVKLQSIADYLAHSIAAGSDGASGVIAAILVYFSIAGFLWGFLVTRLILEPELDRQPNPQAVSRLANARPPATDVDNVDEHDAAELLRFPPSQLSDPEQLIAWGRAKLVRDPAKAIPVLGRALAEVPDDRRAIDNLVFASLYAAAPSGFMRAIELARKVLEAPGHRDTTADADLLAYLACAYGQQYQWERGQVASTGKLTSIRDSAVDAIKRAIALEPQWRATLHRLAFPAANSREDDLAVLAQDTDLKPLLGT